jgi:methylated-DNA-[protein]-cysteine S-methyltransferase
MAEIITTDFQSPVGELIIGSFDGKLCLCDWKYRKMRKSIDERIGSGLGARFKKGNSDTIELTINQLEEYFKGTRQDFDIPLLFTGSDFQKEVWNELLLIPFGETSTYPEISRKIGNEKAIRAVASANGANAISIIVPCHRVVGSDGDLTGYAGGLNVKKKLLQWEGSYSRVEQMELF